jgi:hypothetical protein
MSDMAEPIQLTVKQFKEMAARIEDSETAMIEFYIDEGGKDHEPLDLIRIGQFHVVPDVVFTFRKPSGQSSLSEKEAEIEKLKAIINGEGMRTNAELRKLNASQKAEIERLRGALYECEEAVFHTIDESKERISRIVNNHIPL